MADEISQVKDENEVLVSEIEQVYCPVPAYTVHSHVG